MSIEELKEVQNRVIKTTKKLNTICLIVEIIVVVSSICFLLFINGDIFNYYSLWFFMFLISFEIIFILAIFAVIKSILTSKDCNTFKNNYKEIFVRSSLKKIFDDLTYKYNKGLDISMLRNTELIIFGDRFSTNDYISGKYKNINFEQADIHIEEKTEFENDKGDKEEVWNTTF